MWKYLIDSFNRLVKHALQGWKVSRISLFLIFFKKLTGLEIQFWFHPNWWKVRNKSFSKIFKWGLGKFPPERKCLISKGSPRGRAEQLSRTTEYHNNQSTWKRGDHGRNGVVQKTPLPFVKLYRNLKFEESCRNLKNHAEICACVVIHAKVLPGSVLYTDDWITVCKGSPVTSW